MRRARPEVWECIEPAVIGLGYELVGIQYGNTSDGPVLRVYIDTDQGITLDDCVAVSQQLSAELDVNDPITEAYRLEVSSPGVDRPLFRDQDYERFLGSMVRVRCLVPVDGQRRFKGELKDFSNGELLLTCDGQDCRLPLDVIEEARLVPSDAELGLKKGTRRA